MLAFRQRILLEAEKLPGFKGAYDLVDRASGKSIAITLWESEDAMRASERALKSRGSDQQRGEGSLPVIESYEVVSHVLPAGWG